MKHLTVCILLSVVVGCDESTTDRELSAFGDLNRALELLEEDGREAAFVIAEDPKNGNYVQFGIMDRDWIHFDIPTFVEETHDFDVEHAWTIVNTLPEIPEAERRNYIDPERAQQLWRVLSDEDFRPYYFRSVYEDGNKTIGATESICFNVSRADRSRCLKAATKVFETVHGYPPPERMKIVGDQTRWAKTPEGEGEPSAP